MIGMIVGWKGKRGEWKHPPWQLLFETNYLLLLVA